MNISREQIASIVAIVLGTVAIALKKVPWIGGLLASMVTDPAFEAMVTNAVVSLLEKFGDSPPATAADCMAAQEGVAMATGADEQKVASHVKGIEQALRAAGAK